MATYEITSPDGTVFEVTAPEGASEADVMAYAQSNFQSEQPPQQEPEQPPLYGGGRVSDMRAALAGGADLATIGFADELKGFVQGQIRGALDPNVTRQEATDFFTQKARQEAGQLQEQNPYAYGAGQIAGGLGTALSAPSLITKGATKLAGRTLPRQIATSGAIGGVSGGVYGYGSGEGGTQERLENVPSSAAYGAGGGAIGAGVAGVVRPLTQRAKGLFTKKTPSIEAAVKEPSEVIEALTEKQLASEVIEDVPKALKKVGGQLQKDFGADLDLALNAYKKGDISLAELYGKRSSSLAQGAAVYPSGRAVAEEFLSGKTAGSYDRVLSSVRKNISGVDNYFTNADDLVNAGRAKASPQYAKAYDDVIQDTDILDVPELQTALKQAYRKYPSELEGVDQSSVKALDYAKRVIDDQIGKAQRSGEGNFARSRTVIKNELLDVMDQASPSYKKARAIAGDYLSVNNAMDEGRKALKTDSELTKKVFKQLGDQEKQAYKIGLGKAIRDEVGKVGEGANPYKRILGSPEKQRRISSILSPEEYKNFERSLKAEDRLFTFRNKVLGGSPTADKLEAQKLIEGGAIDTITGVPKQTFTEAIKTFKTKLLDGMNDKTAAKISDILYETDPVKKLEILDGLNKAKNFTVEERELVKRAYSLVAPKYDALKVSGAATGGAMINQEDE